MYTFIDLTFCDISTQNMNNAWNEFSLDLSSIKHYAPTDHHVGDTCGWEQEGVVSVRVTPHAYRNTGRGPRVALPIYL